MPHIIVMHSADNQLEMPKLLHDLHHALAEDDSVNLNQIKTYAIPLAHCVVSGDTRPDAMIHIQIRMKPGRSEELRTTMAKQLHDVARAHTDARNIKTAISTEIVELHAPSYQSSYSA